MEKANICTLKRLKHKTFKFHHLLMLVKFIMLCPFRTVLNLISFCLLLVAEICLSFCFSSFSFLFFFSIKAVRVKNLCWPCTPSFNKRFLKSTSALPEYSSYPAPDQIKIQWTPLYGHPFNTCLFQQQALIFSITNNDLIRTPR